MVGGGSQASRWIPGHQGIQDQGAVRIGKNGMDPIPPGVLGHDGRIGM